jgi:protein transport protein SEC13
MSREWRLEQILPEDAHQDWVRDVAWAPSIGLPSSTIASCSQVGLLANFQDGAVLIWTQERPGAAWTYKLLGDKKSPQIVWRVSWSVTGNILAVSGGDNKVTLWKESLDGKWKAISTIGEDDAA